MSDLSVMGLAEVLPHLPRLVRRINQTAAAARRLEPDAVVTVNSAELLPAACASAPRLGHSRSCITSRRNFGRGVQAAPRSLGGASITSWPCCRSRRLSSPNTTFPRTYVGHPAIEIGRRSRRRPGLQGAAWAAGGCDRALRASRLEERRGAPHPSRLRRGSAQPQGELPRPSHRHPGGPCRGRSRARQ